MKHIKSDFVTHHLKDCNGALLTCGGNPDLGHPVTRAWDRVTCRACLDRIPESVIEDRVNHPKHYKTEAGIECIDVIEAFKLSFVLGNCVKYILRSANKGNMLEDLRKSRWYLEREIARLEKL